MVSSDAQVSCDLAQLFQQRELGACVAYASTQAEAMRWLQERPQDWDVLIADTALEGGSGLSVLAQCPPPQPHQKVVMLSYLLTEKMQVYCRSLGADLTLDKVHGFELLLAKMALWSGQGGGPQSAVCPAEPAGACDVACC